jgi:SH3 domain protein
LTPLPAQAETRYVTDQIESTLRTGESTRFKILKMLPSGTRVEVLDVNQTTKYARVRTADGAVGFVPEAQLQSEPAARSRLAELETRLAELQQEPDALAARLTKVQNEHGALQSGYQTLEREKQLLEQYSSL